MFWAASRERVATADRTEDAGARVISEILKSSVTVSDCAVILEKDSQKIMSETDGVLQNEHL